MGEELKACPFCGEKEGFELDSQSGLGGGGGSTFVLCSHCLAETPLDVWNRRAPDSLKADLVEALTSALDWAEDHSSSAALPWEEKARAALARAREGEKHG